MWASVTSISGSVLAEASGLPSWAQITVVIAALAVSVLGYVTKAVVPGRFYDAMEQRAERAEEKYDKLIATTLETQPKVVAAMEASNRLAEDAMAENRMLRRNATT